MPKNLFRKPGMRQRAISAQLTITMKEPFGDVNVRTIVRPFLDREGVLPHTPPPVSHPIKKMPGIPGPGKAKY
ncbi:hypothetical protein ACFL4N_03250 [Thermodesulfobacteriota bacterium]